jgi:hypothetical protein
MERSFGVPFSELPQVLKDNLVPDPRRVYVEESPPRSTVASTKPETKKMEENRVSVTFRDGNKSPVVFYNGEMLQGVTEVHAYAGGRIDVVKDGQRLAAKAGELVPSETPGHLPAQGDEPPVDVSAAAAQIAAYFDRGIHSFQDRYWRAQDDE